MTTKVNSAAGTLTRKTASADKPVPDAEAISSNSSKQASRFVEGVPARKRGAIESRIVRYDETSSSSAFVGDTIDVIARMRSGTPARIIPRLASTLGISQDKLFELLDLPKSTVKGRISTNGMLSSTEQDRVYRAEKVLARAIQVLEDEQAALTWLNRENRSLGGEIPLALLDTEPGYELVLDTLGQIEYGVVS